MKIDNTIMILIDEEGLFEMKQNAKLKSPFQFWKKYLTIGVLIEHTFIKKSTFIANKHSHESFNYTIIIIQPSILLKRP
jgi:hypothetical protein